MPVLLRLRGILVRGGLADILDHGTILMASRLPWMIAGGTLALAMTAAAGMYGGYEIASARYFREQQEIKDAHISALEAKNALILVEQRNANRISDEFLAALGNIKIENRTYNQEIRTETVKEIYTDCMLPDSGADMYDRHIEAGNLRLLGRVKP